MRKLVLPLILSILCGCRSTFPMPRTGEYFQSTRRAVDFWGYAGRDGWGGGRINCLDAGAMTLPTVVGPLYFWVVRPIADTIDVAVVSPVVDVACVPCDYVLNHWQRRLFLFVDPDGRPVPGVDAEVVETGDRFRSDDQGHIRFMARDHVTLRVDATRFYCRWSHDIGSDVMKEYVSNLRMPTERERTIQVIRKKHMSLRMMHAVRVLMPGLDSDYYFDCFEGDWVSPYGRGKETNLVFRASGNSEPQLRVDVRLPEEELSGFEECPRGKYGEPRLRSWSCHTNSFKVMRLEMGDRMIPVAFRSHVCGSDARQDVYGMIDGARISRKGRFGVCELELRISVNSKRGEDGFEWADHLDKNDAPAAFKYPEGEVCSNGLHVRGFFGRHLWVNLDEKNRGEVPWLFISEHKTPCGKHRSDGSLLGEPPRLDGKYRKAIDASPEDFSEALGKIDERPYLVQDWNQTLSRSYPKFNPENLRLLWDRLKGRTNEIYRVCKAHVLDRPEMPGDVLRSEFEKACHAKDWRQARILACHRGTFRPDELRVLYHDPRYVLLRHFIAVTVPFRELDFRARESLKKEAESLLMDADATADENAKLRRLHELLEKRLPAEMPDYWPNWP